MDPLQQLTILARAIQTLAAVRDKYLVTNADDETFAGVCCRESWGELRDLRAALATQHGIDVRKIDVGQYEFRTPAAAPMSSTARNRPMLTEHQRQLLRRLAQNAANPQPEMQWDVVQAFQEAATPAVVLDLLEALDKAQQRTRKAERYAERVTKGIAIAAGEHVALERERDTFARALREVIGVADRAPTGSPVWVATVAGAIDAVRPLLTAKEAL